METCFEPEIPTPAISSVQRLSSIVFPSSARERNMAMMSVYFDESTGNGSPILVVAGFLSTDAQWLLFEREWRAVLDNFGLRAFHMQHFATRKGEFRGMDEPVRKRLLDGLLGIIRNRTMLGFASAVHLAAFNELFKGNERIATGSPYNLCALSCNLHVGEWAKSNYQIEPIAFFYDMGNRHGGEVFDTFRDEKKDGANVEYRLGSLTFEDDEILVPLQAADIAAYELWKWLDEHYAEKTRHGRYPLQEIFKKPWKIREWDTDVLTELRDLRRGEAGSPKTIRHLIPALRPGQIDKAKNSPK